MYSTVNIVNNSLCTLYGALSIEILDNNVVHLMVI